MPSTRLDQAREAYARSRWDAAYEGFRQAAASQELGTDDLAALADAAWWLGHNDESLDLSEEVYRRYLHGDRVPRAAKLAIEIGFLWLLRGEQPIGSGWLRRAERLLADAPECEAHGYLGYLEAAEALGAGRFDDAVAVSRRIQRLAGRCADDTLGAIGLALEGVGTVKLGRVTEGLAILDEAMLPVRAGSVAPNWAGNLYCQLMGLFLELADIPRARAWTDATERWCDQYSNAAMFAGICRVHRAQLLNLEGAWADAEHRAARVCDDLADLNVEVVAAGHYEIGELRRVQGDHAGAERAYDRAAALGRDPQPGCARLRLAQGRTDEAAAALEAALEATEQPLKRAPLLTARLDLAEARADPALAAAAADELAATAVTFGTPGLLADAEQAVGTARLLAGDAVGAIGPLRDACRRWYELDARYAVARARVRLARALRAGGDEDAAAREVDVATSLFSELGARDDLAAVDDLLAPGESAALDPTAVPAPAPGGLSARELEVLSHVADGRSNRAIAATLTISERTVERHVANIFVKLGVSSRTEAARFAFTQGVVGARDS